MPRNVRYSGELDGALLVSVKNKHGQYTRRGASLQLSPQAQEQDTVWHYTRPAAADNIRASGILRATAYSDLADKNELRYGANILSHVSPSRGLRDKTRMRWLYANLGKIQEDGLANPCYVVCGSLSSRVQYLWDNYATPGEAIGISADEGRRLVVFDPSGKTDDPYYNYTSWGRVLYDPAQQRHFAGRTLDFILDCYPDRQAIHQGLRLFLAYVKEPTYAAEREVRFIVSCTALHAPPCEHEANGRRYLELTYNGLNSSAIDIVPGHEAPEEPAWCKVVHEAPPLPPYDRKLGP